jgi:hypothetical protein
MAEGVEGLTRDKTCKPGKPPPTGTVQRVVNLALGPLPGVDRPDAGESRRGEPAFGRSRLGK